MQPNLNQHLIKLISKMYKVEIKETLFKTVDETFTYGSEILGKNAQPNDIFCLFGPLGVGKTALVKGICAGFIDFNPDLVASPTFSLLNVYEGKNGKNIFHFDLYRLKKPDEFYELGFDEFLEAGGLCCIEWSEHILPILPNWSVNKITLSYRGENERYCEWRIEK